MAGIDWHLIDPEALPLIPKVVPTLYKGADL